MSDAIGVVVKVTARPETAPHIAAIVRELAAQSRQETGCVRYEVLQDMTKPECFLLVEEWTSAAALDAHNRTPHFHKAVAASQALLAAPLEVGRYRIEKT